MQEHIKYNTVELQHKLTHMSCAVHRHRAELEFSPTGPKVIDVCCKDFKNELLTAWSEGIRKLDSPQLPIRKRCFIITPVGDDNSDTRRKADSVIDHSIIPVLEQLEFEALPPHRQHEPGSLPDDIIRNILETDLVIANLTEVRPNVVYELGIRHTIRRPVVLIAERGTQLPFDFMTDRTIFYANELGGHATLMEDLKFKINAAMNAAHTGNPIARVMDQIQYAEIQREGTLTEKYLALHVGYLTSKLSDLDLKMESERILRHRFGRYHSLIRPFKVKVNEFDRTIEDLKKVLGSLELRSEAMFMFGPNDPEPGYFRVLTTHWDEAALNFVFGYLKMLGWEASLIGGDISEYMSLGKTQGSTFHQPL